MPHRFRTYMICLLGALTLGAVAPSATASSSSSCNETAIYNQAYKYQKITGDFSIACLQKARRDESAEMRTYSNVDGIIAAAIAKAQFVKTYSKGTSPQVKPTQTLGGTSPTVAPSDGHGATAATGGHESTSTTPAPSGVGIVDPPSKASPLTRALASAAPSQAGDMPTPVIVLGALTALFVLGGIGSYLLRRHLNRGTAA
jgi:hypothetical protein